MQLPDQEGNYIFFIPSSTLDRTTSVAFITTDSVAIFRLSWCSVLRVLLIANRFSNRVAMHAIDRMHNDRGFFALR